MKSIIKFAIIFIISFICFNQGMNDIFEDYIITSTKIIMVIAPILAVVMFLFNEIFNQTEDAEIKIEDEIWERKKYINN